MAMCAPLLLQSSLENHGEIICYDAAVCLVKLAPDE